MKVSEFIDNKLHYYLKSTDLSVPIFYGQPKMQNLCFYMSVASHCGSPLHNHYKYIANILKAYVEDENNNGKDSTTFPTKS